MKKVVIFGTSIFAELAHFYLTHDSDFEIVAFTVHENQIKENEFQGLPVIPFEKIESMYPSDKFCMFIAIGYTNLNKKRANVYHKAKSKGYELLSFIHPTTRVWDEFEMGENCFIFENNVIQPFVKLGNDVIIWSNNVISHHTTIKDHCFIISHVAIAGNVTIEPNCFVGMNATIRNGITGRLLSSLFFNAHSFTVNATTSCELSFFKYRWINLPRSPVPKIITFFIYCGLE